MATAVAAEIKPDNVVSFQIVPGTYRAFRDAMGDEGGPRLKCFMGDVTLVSPSRPHESAGTRIESLVLAVAEVMRIPISALASTTWELHLGAKDTGYEADKSYYVQSHGTAPEGHRPDLAIEIVVSNPETKAMRCGQLLGIPEMWVLDLNRHRLNFYHLVDQGEGAGTYRVETYSRAFPFLESHEVLERLDDPEDDDAAFPKKCRVWARRVLRPRVRGARENP